MEDIIMESVESLNGSNLGEKLGNSKLLDDNQDAPLKPLPKLFYSRELLLKLRKHPMSKEKPSAFDLSDCVSKSGLWDPEHWHSRTSKDSKRPTSSISSNAKEDQEKKRGKDEADEFCFTPQRRSFVSGCHVVPAKRPEPEATLPPIINESARESNLASRRVGSGRLSTRDSEPVPPKDPRDRREGLRVAGSQRDRGFERDLPRSERGNERNDRNDRIDRNDRNERNVRGFPARADPRDKVAEKDRRNFERPGFDREYNSRGDRYNDRRKNEDDTPEWFFGGPSSQHDTIELRGFDDEKDKSKNNKASNKKDNAKERPTTGVKRSEEGMVNGSSRPASGLSGKVDKDEQASSSESIRKPTPTQQDPLDFNIEDFLKMDTDGLNGFGLGSVDSEDISRSSKASRWFGKSAEPENTNKPSVPDVPEQLDNSSKEDPGRSILEMLCKGTTQQQQQPHLLPEHLPKKVVTAEELERRTGKIPSNEHNEDDGLTVFNKLLAQVQDTAVKPHAIINNAPTEQDILANLLGKQMKIDAQQSLPNNAGHHHQPQQDALSKFLQQQHSNQMHHVLSQPNNPAMLHNQQQVGNLPIHALQPPQAPQFFQAQPDQPIPDMAALIRDVANGFVPQNPQALNQLHLMALQQQQHQQHPPPPHQLQHHHHQQQNQQQQQQQQQQNQNQQRQNFSGSPQQSATKQSTASSSPLSFTPTAVMRKMTADKDKNKASSQDKSDSADTAATTSSPPAVSSATSSRLTGRTASQVQGANRANNQLRMNDPVVAQQPPQPQQPMLSGRPLLKGQESVLPFQQQQQMGNRPFGMVPSSANAAITGVAVKMLEQQQQHQLLAAAVAASANQAQQQIKQQLLQQQQRTSPLQHQLMAFAGGLQPNLAMQNRGIPNNVPVGNRTHFRPIHPQPMIPPMVSSGYSSFMGNQGGIQAGQNRLPNNMGQQQQFAGGPQGANLRAQAQGLNALAALQQQTFGGNRSPNMLQGGNPLSRWFPPEILSQAGAGQLPTLPPMPNQKILSLEELERLHTSPMSH